MGEPAHLLESGCSAQIARVMRVSVLPALLLATLGFATPAPAQTPESVQMLRPGDVVRLVVWRQEDLSGDFTVGPDSALVHPLYREVKVAGVPLPVAEERLRDFLRRYQEDPRIILEPQFRVTISGEVSKPDLYTLSPDVTVAEAIAQAGGITGTGVRKKVRLLRNGEEYRLDLRHPDVGLASLPVRSGDQILVEPKRRDYFGRGLIVVGIVTQLIQFMFLVQQIK
jgi:polysaccharide export outer membrane protein